MGLRSLDVGTSRTPLIGQRSLSFTYVDEHGVDGVRSFYASNRHVLDNGAHAVSLVELHRDRESRAGVAISVHRLVQEVARARVGAGLLG